MRPLYRLARTRTLAGRPHRGLESADKDPAEALLMDGLVEEESDAFGDSQHDLTKGHSREHIVRQV